MAKSSLYPMTHRMMRLAGPISVLKLNLQIDCHRIWISRTNTTQCLVLLSPPLNQGFSQKCPYKPPPRTGNCSVPIWLHLRDRCVCDHKVPKHPVPLWGWGLSSIQGWSSEPPMTRYLTWRMGSWWTHSDLLLTLSKILVVRSGWEWDRKSCRIALGSRSKLR